MPSYARLALAVALALPTLALGADALALAGAAPSARVRLWDDADHDGAPGSPGDVLRAETFTHDGTFALAATGCARCAVVIDRVQGTNGAPSPAVALRVDGAVQSAFAGALWRDEDRDGAHGGAGDTLVGTTTTQDGSLSAPGSLCAACGLVIVDWVGSGQDIDWIGSGQDIDQVAGAILDWGGSSQDIDWGGSGDEIDWGGSGDEIDWGGSGDDIDWSGSGDDIDWGGSGDEIDAGAGGR